MAIREICSENMNLIRVAQETSMVDFSNKNN